MRILGEVDVWSGRGARMGFPRCRAMKQKLVTLDRKRCWAGRIWKDLEGSGRLNKKGRTGALRIHIKSRYYTSDGLQPTSDEGSMSVAMVLPTN